MLSLGYELIPLPVLSPGSIQPWYWLCSESNQLCLPASQLEHPWATEFMGVISSPSGQMGLKGTLHSTEPVTQHLA